MHEELSKEKQRHSYYKNLLRDLGDIDDVKKVLDLSVSDADPDTENLLYDAGIRQQ